MAAARFQVVSSLASETSSFRQIRGALRPPLSNFRQICGALRAPLSNSVKFPSNPPAGPGPLSNSVKSSNSVKFRTPLGPLLSPPARTPTRTAHGRKTLFIMSLFHLALRSPSQQESTTRGSWPSLAPNTVRAHVHARRVRDCTAEVGLAWPWGPLLRVRGAGRGRGRRAQRAEHWLRSSAAPRSGAGDGA